MRDKSVAKFVMAPKVKSNPRVDYNLFSFILYNFINVSLTEQAK